MIPCVLTPDISFVGEEPNRKFNAQLEMKTRLIANALLAYLEPNAGLSSVTS